MTDDQFDQIFRQEYPRLYRLAYSMLRNQEECRDIVSQVMTNLYERPPRETDNRQALAAYLSQAVRSRCLDYIEHLEIEQRAQKLYPLDYKLQIYNDHAQQSKLKEVWRFINEQLTQQTRQILLMRYDEDLSYQEVAQRLQVSVSAVNKHVSEGLRKLREHFKKES